MVHEENYVNCKCNALFYHPPTGPALAGAGHNARPRCGAPLSSGFMTSSCSVSRGRAHI